MTKIITASLTFEYLVEEDELMSEMSDDEQLEYVRETTLEDISEMVIRYSDELSSAIDIKVTND